jgi:Flp pilus assembly protein TadD
VTTSRTSTARGHDDKLARAGADALQHGRVDEAISLLRTATSLDPSQPLAWRTLGLAFERARNPREALGAYNRFLKLRPSGEQATAVRARIKNLQPLSTAPTQSSAVARGF